MAENKEFNKIVVAEEVAKKEVDNWTESRRIKPSKRKRLENNEEFLIECVMYGLVEFQKDKEGKIFIKQNLYDPFRNQDGETHKDSLIWKVRMLVKQIKSAAEAGKSDVGQTIETISRLTDIGGSVVVEKMDYNDYEISACIAMYFL